MTKAGVTRAADVCATAEKAVAAARDYVEQQDLRGSWFELGGSSLDAARLVTRLRQELGVRTTLTDLLLAPSVHDFLTALGSP